MIPRLSASAPLRLRSSYAALRLRLFLITSISSFYYLDHKGKQKKSHTRDKIHFFNAKAK